MQLPTTLLRHEAPGRGTPPHYDWLIATPPAPQDSPAGLWTARVAAHWNDWAALGQIELTPLPRHRPRYLRWAGTLSGQRGWVWGGGRGVIVPTLWTPRRIELTLEPWLATAPAHNPLPSARQPTTLGISLRRVGERWRGVVSPDVR
ncbi:MAG: hypothetical protein AAF911_05730 [Planctomycetota bacterium]